jgi:hypothetical protein
MTWRSEHDQERITTARRPYVIALNGLPTVPRKHNSTSPPRSQSQNPAKRSHRTRCESTPTPAHLFWPAFSHPRNRHLLQSPNEPRMMAIHLLIGLLAGEPHGESVGHDNVVARVNWACRVSKCRAGARGSHGRERDVGALARIAYLLDRTSACACPSEPRRSGSRGFRAPDLVPKRGAMSA